jgi:hypothetical protein
MAVMVIAALIGATLVAYWMRGDCGERITIGTSWVLAGC